MLFLQGKSSDGSSRYVERTRDGSLLHPSQYVLAPAAKELPHCQVYIPWPSPQYINDDVIFVNVIGRVLLLQQWPVFDRLLLGLLFLMLHPRTAHLHSPHLLILVVHKSSVHSVSLEDGVVRINWDIPRR